MAAPLPPTFLRVRDVAALLSVSPGTVRNLCADGTLATVRIGKTVLIPRKSYQTYEDWLLGAGPVVLPVRGRPRKVGAS